MAEITKLPRYKSFTALSVCQPKVFPHLTACDHVRSCLYIHKRVVGIIEAHQMVNVYWVEFKGENTQTWEIFKPYN